MMNGTRTQLLGIALLMQGCQLQAGECQSAQQGRALRIEYRVTDEAMIDGFKAAGAPADVRGVESRIVIRCVGSVWTRTTGKVWVLDTEKSEREMEKLIEGLESGRIDVAKAQPVAPSYEIVVEDTIEVRTPRERFRYDDVTKEGTRRTWSEEERNEVEKGLQWLWDGDLDSPLSNIVLDNVKTQTIGERSVAGHGCSLHGLEPPLMGEYCLATIGKHPVILYTKVDRGQGKVYVEEAVKIETDISVDDELFTAPEDVEFSEG